jgi:hypothetical protein
MAKETYAAKCGANELITPRVYEARLELVDPPRFAYKAGQFITVPVADQTLRSYSICSPPDDPGSLRVAVDIQPGGPARASSPRSRPATRSSSRAPTARSSCATTRCRTCSSSARARASRRCAR